MKWTFYTSMNQRKGMTLIEILLSFSIFSFSIALFSILLRIMLAWYHLPTYAEDTNAIFQLQLMFAQATDFQVLQDNLVMNYHGKLTTLSYKNKKLIKSPGYEVLLQEIDFLNFTKDRNCIHIQFIKKEVTYNELLGCE